MQKRQHRLEKGAQWLAGMKKRQRKLKKGVPVKEKTVPNYVLKKGGPVNSEKKTAM